MITLASYLSYKHESGIDLLIQQEQVYFSKCQTITLKLSKKWKFEYVQLHDNRMKLHLLNIV